MKFSEAMKHLEDGKKVRGKYWPPREYIRQSGNQIIDHSDKDVVYLGNSIHIDWEIYKEPKETEKITFYECIQTLDDKGPIGLVWRTQRTIDLQPNWFKKTGVTKEVEVLSEEIIMPKSREEIEGKT